ncbi:MAG TPA: Uma2 family endonuclease [Pyrinomonadaceae bacterium]
MTSSLRLRKFEMSTSTTASMTAAELLRLPNGQHRYELINGELKTMSPTRQPHGKVTMHIAAPLAQFVWEKKLGEVFAAETGFKLTSNPDTVLAPDISFVNTARAALFETCEDFWPIAPDLVVEVMSPSDRKKNVRTKTLAWLQFGVKQVWNVDLKEETISIHYSSTEALTLTKQDVLSAGDLIPGFKIPVSEIFS